MKTSKLTRELTLPESVSNIRVGALNDSIQTKPWSKQMPIRTIDRRRRNNGLSEMKLQKLRD